MKYLKRMWFSTGGLLLINFALLKEIWWDGDCDDETWRLL